MTEQLKDPSTEAVRELESLLARRKELGSLLISLDAYERWGQGGSPEWESAASKESGEHPTVTSKLKALVAELKQKDPAALVTWAEGHIAVLKDYLSRVADDSTEAYVAKDELRKWKRVKKGLDDFVDENCVHVRPDPTVYEGIFGFPPPTLHW